MVQVMNLFLMWPRPNGDQRSQSEILGTVLVFSLVIIVGTVLIGAGILVFDDASSEFNNRLGEDSLQEVDQRLADAEGGTVLEFPDGASENMEFRPDSGTVTVNVTTIESEINITGVSNETVSAGDILADNLTDEREFDLGSIRYQGEDDVDTVYQGGMLFQREGGEIRILSDPGFDFRSFGAAELANVDLSFTSLNNIGSLGAETFVERNLQESQNISSNFEELVRTHRTFSGFDDSINPTTSIRLNVSIETEYPEAWEKYVRERFTDSPDSVTVNGNNVRIQFPKFGGSELETPDYGDDIVYSGVAGVAPLFYNGAAGATVNNSVGGGFYLDEAGNPGNELQIVDEEYGMAVADGGDWYVLDPSAVPSGSTEIGPTDPVWTDISGDSTLEFQQIAGLDASSSTVGDDTSPDDWVFDDGTSVCVVRDSATNTLNDTRKTVADGSCNDVTLGDTDPPEQSPELTVSNAGFSVPTVTVGQSATIEADIENVGSAFANKSFVGAAADLGNDELDIVAADDVSIYPFEGAKRVSLSFTVTDNFNPSEPVRIFTVDDADSASLGVSNAPYFNITSASRLDVGALPGEPFNVTATINNTGRDATQTVALVDNNGDVVDTEQLQLDRTDPPKSVELTWDVPVDATIGPSTEVTVETVNTNETVNVPRKPEAIINDVTVQNSDPGDVVPVDVRVENPSATLGKIDATIEVNDSASDLVTDGTGGSWTPNAGGGGGSVPASDSFGPGTHTIDVSNPNLNEIRVTLDGAGGGDGYDSVADGGAGGRVEAEINVSSLSTLQVYVGTAGEDGNSGSDNGGSGNLDGGDAATEYTGAGGAPTEIYTGSGDFVIAADGGGGGGDDPGFTEDGGGGGAAGGAGGDAGAEAGDSRSVSVPVASSAPGNSPNTGGDGGQTGGDDGGDGGYVYNTNLATIDTASSSVGGAPGGAGADGFAEYQVTDQDSTFDLDVKNTLSPGETAEYAVAEVGATGTNDVTGSATITINNSTVLGHSTPDITGLALGTTKVTAEYNGQTDTEFVSVTNTPTEVERTIPANSEVIVSFTLSQESNPITDWVPVSTNESSGEGVGIVERSGPNCGAVSWPSSGTSGDPYEISNIDELQCVQFDGLYDDNAYFELVDDIAAQGTEFWDQQAYSGTDAFGNPEFDVVDGFSPIGPRGNRYVTSFSTAPPPEAETFNGIFDGNQHVIDGLYSVRQDEGRFAGLFGATAYAGNDIFDADTPEGSRLENVIIENATVRGVMHVGVLAGQAGGEVVDSRTDGDVTAQYQIVGGMIGDGANADLDNRLVASGTVTGGDTFQGTSGINDEGIGGLVGRSSWNTKISIAYTQDIVVNGPDYVGAITGTSSYRTSEFEQLYTTGTVSNVNGAGALVGRILDGSDEFEESTYWNTDIESAPVGDYGNHYISISPFGVTTDWQGRVTDEMEGPSVLPDDPSFDYDQYPGVTQADADGEMSELDWSIWEPKYETEIDPTTGTLDIVNEDYPIFEWQADGRLRITDLEVDPDDEFPENSSGVDEFLPGPDNPSEDTLEVEVEVENTGGTVKTQTVTLQDPRPGETSVVDSKTVTVDPGDDEDIELEWKTGPSDRLDNNKSGRVTVSTENDVRNGPVHLLPFVETDLKVESFNVGKDTIEAVNEELVVTGGSKNTAPPDVNFTISADGNPLPSASPDELDGEQIALVADDTVVDVVVFNGSGNNLHEQLAGTNPSQTFELSWVPTVQDIGSVDLEIRVLVTPEFETDEIDVVSPSESVVPGDTLPIDANVDLISGG
jgi:hypothetical protein